MSSDHELAPWFITGPLCLCLCLSLGKTTLGEVLSKSAASVLLYFCLLQVSSLQHNLYFRYNLQSWEAWGDEGHHVLPSPPHPPLLLPPHHQAACQVSSLQSLPQMVVRLIKSNLWTPPPCIPPWSGVHTFPLKLCWYHHPPSTLASTPSLRVVLISDTHSHHARLGTLPPGDLLIHAGHRLPC